MYVFYNKMILNLSTIDCLASSNNSEDEKFHSWLKGQVTDIWMPRQATSSSLTPHVGSVRKADDLLRQTRATLWLKFTCTCASQLDPNKFSNASPAIFVSCCFIYSLIYSFRADYAPGTGNNSNEQKADKAIGVPTKRGTQISITESYKYKGKFGMIIKSKNIQLKGMIWTYQLGEACPELITER